LPLFYIRGKPAAVCQLLTHLKKPMHMHSTASFLRDKTSYRDKNLAGTEFWRNDTRGSVSTRNLNAEAA